jgi:hypothetical protein
MDQTRSKNPILFVRLMIAVSLNVTMSNPLHHHVTVMQALREFPTVEENVAGPKKNTLSKLILNWSPTCT